MRFFITILSFLLSLFINTSLSYANSTNFFTPNWWKTASLEDVAKELANGASVKERNKYGWTPLMYASRHNENPEIITTLLKHGASVNERGLVGIIDLTPLILASESNQNPEIITTLLKHGASVKERDINGWTPLMSASNSNQNPEIITTLLKHGADAKARSNEGKTALDYAKDNPKIYQTEAYWDLNQVTYE